MRRKEKRLHWIPSQTKQYLNNNALYWFDTASVAPTEAITLKARRCVFQHTQQKHHSEVQSPQTSKTILISLQTTTKCFVVNLLMLYSYKSHCCQDQGFLLRVLKN